MKLAAMRQDFEAAHTAFKTLLAERYGVDERTWYRAFPRKKWDPVIGRRNSDTSQDAALAADKDIRAAHDEYVRLFRAFYLARDGGVLGGRGL